MSEIRGFLFAFFAPQGAFFIQKKPDSLNCPADFHLFGGELVLAHHAQGALEVFGDILPLGAGSDAALGVTQLLVIFPAADVADILHNSFLHVVVVCCFSLWPYYSHNGGFLP